MLQILGAPKGKPKRALFAALLLWLCALAHNVQANSADTDAILDAFAAELRAAIHEAVDENASDKEVYRQFQAEFDDIYIPALIEPLSARPDLLIQEDFRNWYLESALARVRESPPEFILGWGEEAVRDMSGTLSEIIRRSLLLLESDMRQIEASREKCKSDLREFRQMALEEILRQIGSRPIQLRAQKVPAWLTAAEEDFSAIMSGIASPNELGVAKELTDRRLRQLRDRLFTAYVVSSIEASIDRAMQVAMYRVDSAFFSGMIVHEAPSNERAIEMFRSYVEETVLPNEWTDVLNDNLWSHFKSIYVSTLVLRIRCVAGGGYVRSRSTGLSSRENPDWFVQYTLLTDLAISSLRAGEQP
ncbi:MAG: hypothetical protein KF722_18400 [Nitrospira sp.]|nr:hypothetical protein [Nitrospira sp.]